MVGWGYYCSLFSRVIATTRFVVVVGPTLLLMVAVTQIFIENKPIESAALPPKDRQTVRSKVVSFLVFTDIILLYLYM